MPAEALTCKNQTCGKELPDTGKKFLRCSSCTKITCRNCKASHDNINCKTYQEGQNEKPSTASRGPKGQPGLDSADSKKYEADTFQLFNPGEEYVCGARLQGVNDYCCFSVVLHEGSQRFWCPLCLAKHSILTDGSGKRWLKRELQAPPSRFRPNNWSCQR
ncbi:uncharacterized protein LOC115322795 [Ixodes scapularis]|uniref:uncharacterized protein LOC115322795 n=1 Tax=Ixodes scapularis TaxID=6945 RepID=UPI001A9D43B1|nr:uncharacterized protein LOC115322795 [Ixodes scapularis]XP_040072335.1 uncharacterized protein LOC115322795 [Ixodes scapularis]